MSNRLKKKLPDNCIQCGKTELGICPYHMGERGETHLSNKVARGLRKYLSVDGLLPDGRSMLPSVIVLVPTLRCNLSCSYCFQRKSRNNGQLSLPEEQLNLGEWQAMIEEIKPTGIPIIVMGGELFLYADSIRLLRLIKSADLHLSIITNGFSLATYADELIEMGVNQIIVSIDGPLEVHNKVRNHPNSYQRAIEGIRHVITRRGVCSSPIVQVSCTISSYTQAYLCDFVGSMANLGVDRIEFNNLIYVTPEQVTSQTELLHNKFGIHYLGWNVDKNAYEQIDSTLIHEQLLTIRSGPWKEKVFVMPPGTEQNLQAYYDLQALSFKNQFCTAIYRELWVFPNGELAGCGHLNELSMGNIHQDGVMNVWNGWRFRQFRQQMAHGLLPACEHCEKLTYHYPR